MRRPPLFRLACVAIATALALPVATSSPGALAAAPAVNRTALTSYLVGQLYDANSYQPYGPGFADTGLTADGALALSAAGGHEATVARITDFVAGQARAFADPTDADHAFSGGGVAKLALLAEVTGADPHSFGGYDLIRALTEHVCTVAADGTACPAVGLYRGVTSVFGQSLALIAQARSGPVPPAATSALVSSRCADRSFGSVLPTAACSAGEVDSTSIAAQALAAVGGRSGVVNAAVAWIAARQERDGGFPGAAGDNTNSAALAVQAMSLRASAYAGPIARAQAFLAARQNRDGGLGVNTTSDGAASDVRASTQGLNGAVGTPLSTLTRAVGRGTSGGARSAAAARGAAYLTSSAVLSGGTHIDSGGYADYGLTADIAIALAAAGGPDARLKPIVTYLRAHVAAYADPDGKAAGFPGPYSGSLAKLALLAEITGQNPHSFGGYDLLGLLRAHQCTKADAGGTCTAPGDFYQAFSGVSQALGVLALARAGSIRASDPAVVRLRQLQCPDGGFSSTLPPASPCASEVDTTGFALQALALVRDDSTASTSAAADSLVRGQDYVLAAARADGSFPGAAGNNTNSTALAVQALLASPATRRVPTQSGSVRAAVTVTSPGALAIRGALTFLTAEQNADGGFGINADATASDARASAQVVTALTSAALDTVRHPVRLAAFIAPAPSSTSTSTTSSSTSSSSKAASSSSSTVSSSAAASSSASSSASAWSVSASSARSSRTVSVGGAAAVTASSSTGVAALANTGLDRRALNRLLIAALVLLVGGSTLIAAGVPGRPRGRHR